MSVGAAFTARRTGIGSARATTSTSDSRVDARDSEIDEEEEMDIALTVAAEQPQCRSKGRDAELLPRTGVFLMFMI